MPPWAVEGTAGLEESSRTKRVSQPDRIVLEVIGGPMDGERRATTKGALTIGRTDLNDLSLYCDTSVSGSHARVLIEDGHYWLEDLDSKNGTFIGDGRVQGKVAVGAGAVFVVGQTTLELISG